MITPHIRARTGFIRHPKTAVFRGTYLSFNRIENKPGIDTAATDGPNLYLNIPWMEQWSVEEQIGVIVHECYHRMLKHHLRFKPLLAKARLIYPGLAVGPAHTVYNIACDYRINTDMIADGFKLPKDGIFDTENRFTGMSSERIFFLLLKDAEGGTQFTMPAWGTVGDMPGSEPGGGASEVEVREEEQRVDRQVAAGIALAKKAGKLPGGIEEIIKEGQPKVDWRNLMLEALQRIAGSDEFSLSRVSNPARRNGIIQPGLIGHRVGKVVVALDTSGSITKEIAGFCLAQVNDLVRTLEPEGITLLQCDARVQAVQEMAEGETLPVLVIKGRGGTSFVPVFDWVAQQEEMPTAIIYLTDGLGRFPAQAPDVPAIWLITTNVVAPFGNTIKMDL